MNAVAIQVSTAFLPDAEHQGLAGIPADTIIFANNGVCFYVHRSVLASRSSNRFASFIPPLEAAATSAGSSPQSQGWFPQSLEPRFSMTPPGAGSASSSPQSQGWFPHSLEPPPASAETWYQPPPLLTFTVPEPAAVLNVMLHMVYRIPCQKYGPGLDDISRALQCLPLYGIAVATTQDSDVWGILMQHASASPFQVFAIAACHGMEAFCVVASEYALRLTPSDITEEQASLMGPIYLRRLMFMFLGRRQACLRVCSTPPHQHQPTVRCSLALQQSVVTAWRAATGVVATDPLPHNISPKALMANYADIVSRTTCEMCQDSIRGRVQEMGLAWRAVKRTI